MSKTSELKTLITGITVVIIGLALLVAGALTGQGVLVLLAILIVGCGLGADQQRPRHPRTPRTARLGRRPDYRPDLR